MDKYLNIFNLIKGERKKERFDIILEPLQAITQLAFISFCPKGSKLTISNNLLFIQEPNWFQGLLRSYNNDVKEDLFFLFNAIIRFNKFYIFMKNETNETNETNEFCDLFDLLIQLSKRGVDKLMQTYSTTDQPSLLHTLQLYRVLLDNPNILSQNEEHVLNKRHCDSNVSGIGVSNNNVDDIFINIRTIYSTHEFIILYQTLILLEKNPQHYDIYLQGINTMFSINYNKIQKWVSDNIVF